MENSDYFYQYLKIKFGYIRVRANNDKVLGIDFIAASGENRPNEITRSCMRQLEEYFSGLRRLFTCPLEMDGTPFRRRVWTELLNVPYGSVITYKQLARRIGRPHAYRAVAGALAANHLPVIIPCHRVIASDGTLGGYTPGIEIKKWLLDIEGVTL